MDAELAGTQNKTKTETKTVYRAFRAVTFSISPFIITALGPTQISL